MKKNVLSLIFMAAFSGCHEGLNNCVLACVPRPLINPLSISKYSNQYRQLEFRGWLYLDGSGTGSGLIIVRNVYGRYKAYDRNPPDLCPDKGTRLEVRDHFIICPKNQAQWNFSGVPYKGTSCPLIEYRVWYDSVRDEIYIAN